VREIRLLWDRILVIPEQELQSDSVIIPDTVKKEFQKGRVAHVGPGKREKIRKGDKLVLGDFIPMDIKVGDYIFYGPHVGQKQKINGIEYLAMNQADVAAIIDG